MLDFIIIDDDHINNMLCTRMIEIIHAGANIQSYTNPATALTYMYDKYSMPGANNVILFLDINMPDLNGWDVLDRLNAFPEQVRKCFKIFILSSSIDQFDKQKAEKHPYVSGYVEKPLSLKIMQELITV